ncbi:MAG: XdhC family protein [Desulfobacca sp.]|uniref:XdhC family protein n=1 Tax=Desulfobacca sp. TaxID=2067990 RepID=UPI00404B490B
MTLSAPPSVFAVLNDCQLRGEAAVLAIIVASHGSTPQKIGAKIVVREEGTAVGTVGGGAFEARVIREALAVLQAGTPRLLEIDLSADEAALCGGRVSIYLEPVLPPPHLYIIGAGHVGLALAPLAVSIGFQVTLLDDRPTVLPSALNQVRCVQISDYGQPFAQLPLAGQAYIVIASRSHQHDLEALLAALRTPAVYIGLLGSSRKKTALAQQLTAMGLPPAELARVYIPVGLDLGAVSPAEIAVSIAAQLIAQRRKHATINLSPALSRRLLQPDGSA